MGLVLDASALIIFHELGLLERLLDSDLTAIVPAQALREAKSPRIQELAQLGKFQIVTPERKWLPLEFVPLLGEGETGVLTYCLENREHWAIVDDLVGRKIAKRLGIKYAGSARLLRYMAARGLVGDFELRVLYARMKDLGFWIDDETLNRVLTENPPDFSK